MATPDDELPVWTFRANWAEPITERLGWLTDVLPSSYGPEQRRALRLSPRREFEVKFNPIDEARSYFELWLHRLGSDEFMLPLYHDAAKLTAGVVDGGAVMLPFDTTYREFVVGGMAIIMGSDPFSCEAVNVTALADDGITVTGMTKPWPKGTTVHPLRRSRLEQESALSALTTHVGDATMLFQLNQGNDIPDEGVWDALFNGHPILTAKPNRRENIDLDFQRNSLVLDNDHGLRELGDDAGRAFTVQSHMTMQRGRAEHWAFRQFLYRLRGQQSAIWIPSFNRDLRLSQPYTAADAELAIKKIGYELTGGAVSGRRYVLFADGTTAKVANVGVPPSATEESLVLTDPLAVDLAAGLYGSFMDTCRLASDDIEITHHTSTDGVAECNLAFRSFRDERVIPNPIQSLIPYALKSVDACGVPAEATCVPDLSDDSAGGATDGTGDPDIGGGGGGMISAYKGIKFSFDGTLTWGTPEDLAGRDPSTSTVLAFLPVTFADIVAQFPELTGVPHVDISGSIQPDGPAPAHGPYYFGIYYGGIDYDAWIAADGGGPYAETTTYWDVDNTVVKTVHGRGYIIDVDGTIYFFDFTKYYIHS